jgi:glutaredoxin
MLSVDGGGPLVLTWIDEQGTFQLATTINEIPEKRRALVRVQDPRRPPTGAAEVWVTDLRQPQEGGYPLRSMARAAFEKLGARRPAATKPPPTGDGGVAAPALAGRVVMYVSSTCPVCHRARTWLTQRGVPFVERNIERDRQAAQELQAKARRQGVAANGVPVFDINGRLIPGFDERLLGRLLPAPGGTP